MRLLDDLVAASTAGPLLVVIDDLHWADSESRRALTFAVRRLLAEPVGLLLGGRPECAVMPGLTDVPRLDLGPLDLGRRPAWSRSRILGCPARRRGRWPRRSGRCPWR